MERQSRHIEAPALRRQDDSVAQRDVRIDETTSLVIATPGGQRITLDDSPGSVGIEDANGNSVTLATSGLTINASAKVTLNASNVDVSAGMITVNAGMSKFSGVVQCDTISANSVVGASYTPGAGKIW
jgi:hypothetical protein